MTPIFIIIFIRGILKLMRVDMRVKKNLITIMFLLFVFSQLMGQGQKENISSTPSSIPIEKDLFIYNVLAVTDFDIVILKRIRNMNDSKDTAADVILLAISKDQQIVDFKKDLSCVSPFSPAYFISKDIFLIATCETLFVFDSIHKKFREIPDTFSGCVYIKDNFIFSEIPLGRGKKYDMQTLKLVEEYRFKAYRIPDVFKDIDSIYLSPANLVKNGDIIDKYRKFLKLKFLLD
jgi:hypothetical protein